MTDEPPTARSSATPRAPRPITIGRVQVETVIGSGGEGVVWKGRYLEHGRQVVAVKIMSSRYADDPTYRARFYAEVRAMAALNHPRIAAILDYGLVTEEAASKAEGMLTAGTPYLVMEYAPGGPLQSLLPLRDFAHAKGIILDILDGLAHAHARGLVHRDIKPGNILLLDRKAHRPGILLTDFGIAFAMTDAVSQEHRTLKDRLRLWKNQAPSGIDEDSLALVSAQAGTPAYMAPEQIHGDLVNIGPWTDIYALGCVAYRLITGHTPFYSFGPKIENILHAHLHAIVPPLSPLFEVPDGLHEWFASMLAKAPWDRFQRAADAADAFRKLGDEGVSVPVGTPPRQGDASVAGTTRPGPGPLRERSASQDDIPTSPEIPLDDNPTIVDDALTTPDGTPPEPREVLRYRGRDFPTDWRLVEADRRDKPLTAAGLNLFGLREVPFVGRESERSVLWDTLGSTITDMSPFFAGIHGPSGVGKSRLARWLCETADEIGWAEVFKAVYSPFSSRGDGIGAMLARVLRCPGLTVEQMFRQARHVLQGLGSDEEQTDEDLDFLAMALAELMSSRARPDSRDGRLPRGLLTNQDARFAVVTELLRRKARHRPVLLWLDDVQWGIDALALARYVMENAGSSPILILATYRDEELAERPGESELIAALSGMERARDLALEPLTSEAQSAIIRQMLELEDDLVQEVVRRSGAYPLYASQLIADWLDRGLLQDTGKVFTLAKEATATIPDDLYDMWHRRIDRMDHRFGSEAHSTLEIASALGAEVDRDDWTKACDLAGLTIPEGMVDWLVETGLVKDTEPGWTFIHPMLREALERHAKEEGRWAAAHEACARALLERHGKERSEWSGDIGRHFVEANSPEPAITPLLQAAERASLEADFPAALEDLALAQQCLNQVDQAGTDPRRKRKALLEAKVLYRKGDFDGSQALLEQLLASDSDQEPDVRAEAWRAMARLLRMRGKLLKAREAAQKGAELFRSLGDEPAAATCDVIVARLHFESTGDNALGLELAQSAEGLFTREQDDANLAETQYIKALLLLAMGRRQEAIDLTQEARIRYGKVGNRFGEAACENFLGEVARQGHRFRDAVGHYRRAARILQSIGSDWTHVQRINMALTLVQSEHYSRARRILEALRTQEFGMKEAVSCYMDYALLVCSAHEGNWPEWDDHWSKAVTARPETGRVDRDLAELALLAGRKAAEAGEKGRARDALELSAQHWRALNDSDALVECETLLGSLDRAKRDHDTE